jgi:hypothetical protein
MSQQNKSTLQSAINTQLADNTSGDISAADVRDNLINMTDSLVFNEGTGQTITGGLTVTGGITGSLQGTATTASYVTTAQTASYVITAQTASYVLNAVSASYATTAATASYVSQSYTIYKALLSFNAGTFTTSSFENTIGDITWSNPSNGVIAAAKTGAFTSFNVGVSTPILNANGTLYLVTGQRSTNNVVLFQMYDLDGSPLGSTPYFSNFLVEIIVK